MVKKIIKDNFHYLILIVLILLLFKFVFNSNIYYSIIKLDNEFFLSLNDFRSQFLTIIFKIITFFGNAYIPIAVIVCMLLFVKNKWFSIIQIFAYAFAGIITFLSKLLYLRARPINALIKIPYSYSFPSGHTLTSIVFYVILAYLLTYNNKKEIRSSSVFLSLVFALLISFSRVYLGVHYLSDVIGGIILSIPILLMLVNIINYNLKNKISGK